jgi:hypothetical protein
MNRIEFLMLARAVAEEAKTRGYVHTASAMDQVIKDFLAANPLDIVKKSSSSVSDTRHSKTDV